MPDAVAELSSTLPTLTPEQRADDVPPLLLPVNTSLSPSALQRGFTTGEQFPPFLLQVGSEGRKEAGREERSEGGREGGTREDEGGRVHCLTSLKEMERDGEREGWGTP